jgi:hypothetical protein
VNVNRWLREPLLHFFALGALLFLVFALLNRDALQAPDEIVIDGARVKALRSQFERVWQRQPTAEELGGLVDNWIREEVLYREGLAIGLDREDPVMRRRISQKMSFMAEGFAEDTVDDAEAQAWLDAHEDDYIVDARYTFRQVYFDPTRHGNDFAQTLNSARAALQADGQVPAGDATLLPASLSDASAAEVRRTFGEKFAEALADVDPGDWSQPIASGYGLHLVRIEDVVPARVPTLDEVRTAVDRDVLAARTQAANDAFYQALRSRYTVSYSDDVSIAGNAIPGSRVQ